MKYGDVQHGSLDWLDLWLVGGVVHIYNPGLTSEAERT